MIDDMADVRRLRKQLAQKYPLVDTEIVVAGRRWTITAVKDQDALVDSVETEEDLQHFPYGLLLWASAVGLTERLWEQPGLVVGKKVLELGAGVGLPGMVAQALGGHVTQTDYQRPALSVAQVNGSQNGVAGIEYRVADWRRFDLPDPCDVIIGSDILYERTLHYELSHLIPRVLKPGGTVLISDPMRPQAMEFIDHMEREGWQFTMEGRHVDWDGEQKEIVLFEARGVIA
jgi:predicted nicotinamide N-methyase